MSAGTSSGTAMEAARYRLRDAAGGELRFDLAPGANPVGASSSNTIVLRDAGVSRRHAQLLVAAEGLTLRDLGSKNGTWVNGRRLQASPGEGEAAAAPLAVGDEVAFGPVRLRLEAIHPEDWDLALVLEPPGREGTGEEARPERADGASSHRLLSRGSTVARLEEDSPWSLLGSMLEHLTLRPETDLSGALTVLAEGLGATAAALVRWPRGGGPFLRLAVGEVASVPPLDAFLGVRRDRFGLAVARLSGDPPVAGVVRAGEAEGEGLLLLGSLGPEKGPGTATGLEAFLSGAYRLLHHFEPAAVGPLEGGEGAPARGAEGLPELVFPPGIVPGRAPAMVSLYQQLRPLVRGDLPVLITGETGVGKEHLARLLHLSSARGSGPFVAVNCAALPAELLESEMFGIGRGVATGVQQRSGRFLDADGGTLLLDEIGDMPLELQAKLLRALQDKEIRPLGEAPRAVDVRVVAASNQDLEAKMLEGSFRRDLFYRVAGFVLEVPPLRRRRPDLPRLLGHFLQRSCRELGKSLSGVTVRALRQLSAYPWPGNVRELEHEARRLAHLCPEGRAIGSEMLSERITRPREEGEAAIEPEAGLEASLEKVERRLLRRALARTAGNQSAAARLLGISRNGIAKRLKRQGIDATEFAP